jgi:hypothetical protein
MAPRRCLTEEEIALAQVPMLAQTDFQERLSSRAANAEVRKWS